MDDKGTQYFFHKPYENLLPWRGCDDNVAVVFPSKYCGRVALDLYNPQSRLEEGFYEHNTETWTDALPVCNYSVTLSGNHT